MSRDMNVVKAGTQSADDPFTFIMSSERKDSMGDIIRQDGWQLRDFKRNPIALFGHEHGFPIGTWKNVRVENKRLVGELQFAEKGTSDRIDEIRALVEQRVLKAVSVGFRIQEYEPIDPDDKWGAWDIQKANLLETSVVSVPANPDALVQAKSLGVSKDTLGLVFDRLPADHNRRAMKGEKRQTDFSDLLGDSSDIVRQRRYLDRSGQL